MFILRIYTFSRVDKLDAKCNLIVLFFYFVRYLYTSNYFVLRFLSYPIFISYRFIVYWILGTDIHYKTQIGKNMKIYHGVGTVINPKSIIGDNLIIRHGVTIGNYLSSSGVSGSPVIGNDVELGCGSVILGDIVIGNNVTINSNSLITKNVPDNSTCFGFNKIKTKNTIL